MMKTVLIMLSIICAFVDTKAQINLVKNGGFEQYSQCPTDLDQVSYANYWNGIDTNWNYSDSIIYDPPCLPDYINGCSTNINTREPNNARFYHYPRTGNGMMQMVLYCDVPVFGDSAIENNYLQGQLYSNLIAGQSYCVTFYTLREKNAYAINNIGAYLDDGIIDTTNHCSAWQTEYTPQIVDTAIIMDTVSWVEIQGSFIANGTERYITIGNFFDTAHTEHIHILPGGHEGTYLIDDVSVIASNATAYAGSDVSIAKGDTAWIGVDSNGDGMPCYWYVLSNPTPIDSGGRIGVHPMDSTTYVVSMDLCGNVTYDTVNVYVSTLGVASPGLSKGEVTVFPNPASDEVTISASGIISNVSISNLVGQNIYNQNYNSEKVVVSISDLPPGIYFVKVNDTIVKKFVVR